MKFTTNLCLALTFLCSCIEKEGPIGELETFWVYSYPVPCENSTTQFIPCLGISEDDTFDFNSETWEEIPMEMEGYTFKPYYFQKLEVLKKIEPKTGKINRKLIRIIAEEKDDYKLLEGSWKVKRFLGEDLPNEKFPKGQSVNILSGIRMVVSTDGCNQITLQIQKVETDKILSFGPMTMTLKACPDKTLFPPFPGISEKFNREGNILTFFSDADGEIAVWEKMN